MPQCDPSPSAGKIGSISHFHCPLAFYHVLCGHKGRENPDIVNSQSLRAGWRERKRPRLSWDRHKIYGLDGEGVEFGLTPCQTSRAHMKIAKKL